MSAAVRSTARARFGSLYAVAIALTSGPSPNALSIYPAAAFLPSASAAFKVALVMSLPVSAAVIAAVARLLASFGILPMLGIDLTTPPMAVERAEPTNALSGFWLVAPAVTKAVAPFTIAVFTIAGRLTSVSAVFIAPDTASPTKLKPADSTAPFMAFSTSPPLVAV